MSTQNRLRPGLGSKKKSTSKKLEPDHNFFWTDGESKQDSIPTAKIFAFDAINNKIFGKSPVEMFELFFCEKIKTYIVEASVENRLDIDIDKLNRFLGICIHSVNNIRRK